MQCSVQDLGFAEKQSERKRETIKGGEWKRSSDNGLLFYVQNEGRCCDLVQNTRDKV